MTNSFHNHRIYISSRLWLVFIALSPFLLGVYCGFNVPVEQEYPRNENIDDIEDVILEVSWVTPFATLTPTPTLTPTFDSNFRSGFVPPISSGSSGDGSASSGGGVGGPEGQFPPIAGEGQPTLPPPVPQASPSAPAVPPPLSSPTTSILPPSGSPTAPASAPTPFIPPTLVPDPGEEDDGGEEENPPPATSIPTPVPTSPPPPPTAIPPTAIPPTSVPPPTAPPLIPMISFDHTIYSTNEGLVAVITVVLDQPTTQSVSVNYSTSNGTAFVGTDYVAALGTLIFNPGETTASFPVPVLDDNNDDPDIETVRLSLSNPVNGILGTPQQATLEIKDDDPIPTITFSSSAYTTDESVPPTLSVQLSHPSGKFISFFYNAGGGTATPGVDYNTTPSLVGFGPGPTGESAVNINFTWYGIIDNDGFPEPPPPETVILSLLPPPSTDFWQLGLPASTTLTINDD